MIIDANMYWMPEALFQDPKLMELFLKSASTVQDVHAYKTVIAESDMQQIVIEKPQGYQNLNYVEGQYHLSTQLSDMDEGGIDHAVLKLPGCQEWLDLDMCRLFNDGMADHVRASGGRLQALAVLPPFADELVFTELERCVNDLGMHGVQLSTHYGCAYLDDAVFRPFFKRLHDLDVPAYVHHNPLPVQYDALLEYDNLRRSYGRCNDQVIAVTRELFSGMFEELPNLKLVHSMLGGGFFGYMNLMFPNRLPQKEAVGRFMVDTDDAQRYVKENIFFEMSHAAPWGKKQLEMAIEIAGADHILFGSSYPVRREWMVEGPAFVNSLDISEEDKALVLSGNAKRIYHV